MVSRDMVIVYRRQDPARRWCFSVVARIELCCDRDRDGEDPGELLQLALRSGLSAGEPVARALGSGSRKKPAWYFSRRLGYNFVTSGSAGSGDLNNPVGVDNVGHSGKAAARIVDH